LRRQVGRVSSAAWIGLIGVAVGALATGVVTSWVAWLAARRSQSRALDDAISDLKSSAHTLVAAVNVSRRVRAEQRLELYMTLLSTQINRVVRAAEVIGRVAPEKHLSKLADDYADAAASCLDESGDDAAFEEAIARVTKGRDDFTAYSRRALESTSD
jgi:hypothetical protein